MNRARLGCLLSSMALSRFLLDSSAKPSRSTICSNVRAYKIGRRAHQAFIHQLLDALLAQAFDVHGAARNEVNDRLLELRTTGQTADAAIHRTFADGLAALAALDQLRALDMGAADRALLGNLYRTCIRPDGAR